MTHLRERALFAAAMMVLCGLALLVAVRDGNVAGANAAACAMSAFAVIAVVRWHKAGVVDRTQPARRHRRNARG